MQIDPKLLSRIVVTALVSVFVLAACSGDKQQAAAQGAAPPAPAVTVLTVHPEAVPMTTELPGRTAPYLIAEVRPQVTGIVKQRPFTEGSEVKAGQVLYQIDPATYQAAYDSAKAALARAEANLHAAKLKAERYAELVKIEAVSKQADDDAAASLKQTQADVASAKAAVDKARIDLDFTRVSSPIAGRAGRSAVTPGALVTANQADALVTVQTLDPIYVDVTQSSVDLLRLRRELAEGRLQRAKGDSVPVKLVLEDGSIYSAEGRLAFSEVTVDQGTGSVTLRAVFPNPKGELLPGMYVRAQLTQGVKGNAVLVPHAALSHDPRGNAQVMVVNGKGKVELRLVKAEQSRGDKWIITDGLAGGERVIVEGLQRARPGGQVQAQEAGAATTSAAGPAAAPAKN
jgi:membrane fusion protein (multidrug efflux system)